jgi:hypothetical protein
MNLSTNFPHKTLTLPVFLLAMIGAHVAVAADVSISPRASAGFGKGWEPTDSAIMEWENEARSDLGWWSADVDYRAESAVMFEIPLMICAKRSREDSVGFIAGPSISYSRSTATVRADFYHPTVSSVYDGSEEIDGVGGRLYAGVFIEDLDPYRLELLGNIGVMHLRSSTSGDQTYSNGARSSFSDSSTANATVYGCTAAAFALFGDGNQWMVGIRCGFSGGSMTLDEVDMEQMTGILAFELGMKL